MKRIIQFSIVLILIIFFVACKNSNIMYEGEEYREVGQTKDYIVYVAIEEASFEEYDYQYYENEVEDYSCNGIEEAYKMYIVLSDGIFFSFDEAIAGKILSIEDAASFDLEYVTCGLKTVTLDGKRYKARKLEDDSIIYSANHTGNSYDYNPVILGMIDVDVYYVRYEDYKNIFYSNLGEYLSVLEALEEGYLSLEVLVDELDDIYSFNIEERETMTEELPHFISSSKYVNYNRSFGIIAVGDDYEILRDDLFPAVIDCVWCTEHFGYNSGNQYYAIGSQFYYGYAVMYENEFYSLKEAIAQDIITLDDLVEIDLFGLFTFQ